MSVMRFPLQNIYHDLAGFSALSLLHTEAGACSSIKVDMRATSWIDADMCAPLGAVICALKHRHIAVKLVNIRDNVKEILSKNGFLCRHVGKLPDTWDTTIAYKQFKVSDEISFSAYVSNDLAGHRGMPKMSAELQKMLSQNVCEIFSNAVLHSRTQLGVFSCGQFFPKKDRLDFTIADLGIGMRRNVENFLRSEISAVEAITWATSGNTTKPDDRPGGMGLKSLCRFFYLNEGCVRIVSDAGYWQRQGQHVTTANLRHPFPGTVVNLEVNTADTKSYVLQSELDSDNLF